MRGPQSTLFAIGSVLRLDYYWTEKEATTEGFQETGFLSSRYKAFD